MRKLKSPQTVATGVLILGGALWAGVCAAVALRQSALLYPLRTDTTDHEHGPRDRATALGFSPFPNEPADVDHRHPVRAWVWSPPVGTTVHGTVVVFHGNSSVALKRAAYAQALGSLGYRIILAEYPGYGTFPGSPTETSIVRAQNRLIDDVLSTFHEPLFLVGESLGSGVAAQVVREHPGNIDGVLLFTPWDVLPEVAAAHYPWMPVRTLMRDRYDSLAALRDYQGPIMIVAAAHDTIVPPKHARTLFDGLSSPRKTWVMLDTGHSGWRRTLTERFWLKAARKAFGRART